MVKHFNFLIEELYTLWRTTATYLVTAITDKELQLLIMHWRVVGIPKKDPKQSRPISVGSCQFRHGSRPVSQACQNLVRTSTLARKVALSCTPAAYG